MNDLKKIAELLCRANVDDNAVVNEVIERLEKLASAEPAAYVALHSEGSPCGAWKSERSAYIAVRGTAGSVMPVYAAPKLAAQEPVAWRWLYDGQPELYAHQGSLCWSGPGPSSDVEQRAAAAKNPRTVQRFYAAPQPPSVSREALWKAFDNELKSAKRASTFDNFCDALCALGIEMTP